MILTFRSYIIELTTRLKWLPVPDFYPRNIPQHLQIDPQPRSRMIRGVLELTLVDPIHGMGSKGVTAVRTHLADWSA